MTQKIKIIMPTPYKLSYSNRLGNDGIKKGSYETKFRMSNCLREVLQNNTDYFFVCLHCKTLDMRLNVALKIHPKRDYNK